MRTDQYIQSDFALVVAILLVAMGVFRLMRGNARANLTAVGGLFNGGIMALGLYILALHFGINF